MADATTAAAPAPPVLPLPSCSSNRKARLDAAIAHFRSEASASGYVVEEVRLRLPVPDIDVLPRVVIAQNGANAAAPPPFPQTKQHRPLPRYPTPNLPNGSNTLSPFTRHRKPHFKMPHLNPISTANATADPASNGFKRTISGSVILNALSNSASPPTTTSSAAHRDRQSEKSGPSSPTSNAPHNSNGNLPQEALRGKFWNTVIAEQRKSKMKIVKVEGDTTEPKSSPERHTSSSEGRSVYLRHRNTTTPDVSPESSNRPVETRKSDAKVSPSNKGDKKENLFRMNQHNIPDSHVQLLLSSVGDMPARAIASDRSSSPPAAGPRTVSSVDSGALRRATRTSHGGRRRDSGGRTSAARPFRCAQCPSSFDREGHLRVHILAVHEKKRPFVCQVCDSAFGHSSSLLRHVRTVHQASPAVGPGSDSSSSGRNDGRIREKEDGRHFRCSVCSIAFSRVAQLNRHVATSHPITSAMPLPAGSEMKRSCRICAQKFPSSDALVAHIKARHSEEC